MKMLKGAKKEIPIQFNYYNDLLLSVTSVLLTFNF